jgi:hypothetical protein
VTGDAPAADGQPARPSGRHSWMTPEDDFQALQQLKAWFADHPDCSDPAEGIAALGLPDMTGVPAKVHGRNRTQQRMAAEATSMLRHAGFAIRHRDAASMEDSR